MAMSQNPNRTPGEHPNPTTKIGSQMGGEFTYPKMILVLTHSPLGFKIQGFVFFSGCVGCLSLLAKRPCAM